MTWETVVALIVAVTGLISALWGIVKYYDNKRTKREEQARLDEKEQVAAMEKQRQEWVASVIRPLAETNEKQCQAINNLEEAHNELNGKVEALCVAVNETQKQLAAEQRCIDANEMSRLQTVIMNFSTLLRNNSLVDLNDFNYIYHAYDRYKELGGNSFIDSEMRYIQTKKDEWDKEHPNGENN